MKTKIALLFFLFVSIASYSQVEDNSLSFGESKNYGYKSQNWIINNGRIFRIDELGATVELKIDSFKSKLNGVQFLSTQIGYAVGDNGLVVKTINGGFSWQQLILPIDDVKLNHLYFVNTNLGYVIGNYGTILKTKDQGINWEIQISPTTKDLDKVCFIDTINGFIVGKHGRVLSTNDGGKKWKRVSDVGFDDIKEIKFLNTKQGYVISSNGVMYKTKDGGRNWNVVVREVY